MAQPTIRFTIMGHDARRVLTSLIPGWPAGELGVAITRNGILLRLGLTADQQARALEWAWLELDCIDSERKSGIFTLDRSSSYIEPCCSMDFRRKAYS